MGQFGEQSEPARKALVVRRQPRFLAKTARDAGGFYPADGANVYPIIFLGGVYTEGAGTQTPPAVERSADALAVAMNIAGADHYIPEGTVLRVWRIGHRYYTYRKVTATGCVYESDDWTRANSDNPGTIWTETAGDWDVLDGTLVTSSADAELTCATLAPGASMKYLVGVAIKFDTDGDVARVKINGGAHFAELERITSTCGRLRIYDDNGGSPICYGSVGVALSEWTQVVVCSEEDKIHVGTGGAPLLSLAATVTSSEIALATGTCTGTIAFDTLRLSKHYDDDNTCPACGSVGCIWFSDLGCSSGLPPAADYTTTGTWAYGASVIECTADGTLAILAANPEASVKLVAKFKLEPNVLTQDAGTKVRFALDDSTTFVECEFVGGSTRWRLRLYSGGVQYGWTVNLSETVSTDRNPTITLCYDGSVLSASHSTPAGGIAAIGAVKYTIATLSPRTVVDFASSGRKMQAWCYYLGRHPDDLASCPTCFPGTCTACESGTMPNAVQVVIAGLVSHSYGCPCPDQTITLSADGLAGCTWVGSIAAPCGGTWTVTATVSAVTGGYRLSVDVMKLGIVIGLFQNTVLGGLPDCLSVFDGSVPRVGGNETSGCCLESATCTFTSPAP